MDWKIELIGIPVSDVERAKAFYTEQAGFVLDHDHTVSDEIRFIQLTPPGSACSITLGVGIIDTPPGSAQGIQMVVPDIVAARAELAERGVAVSEVQHFDWGDFIFFNDPDGNGWSVQQLPPRDCPVSSFGTRLQPRPSSGSSPRAGSAGHWRIRPPCGGPVSSAGRSCPLPLRPPVPLHLEAWLDRSVFDASTSRVFGIVVGIEGRARRHRVVVPQRPETGRS